MVRIRDAIAALKARSLRGRTALMNTYDTTTQEKIRSSCPMLVRRLEDVRLETIVCGDGTLHDAQTAKNKVQCYFVNVPATTGVRRTIVKAARVQRRAFICIRHYFACECARHGPVPGAYVASALASGA